MSHSREHCMSNQKMEKALLGERLRAVRERAHVGIDEAAQAAGVQPLAIEKWERGSSLPSLIEFRALLPLYGVTACEVLYEDNPIELSPEQFAELSRAARTFSPGLRARVDVLLAMYARGKEPVWKVSAGSEE